MPDQPVPPGRDGRRTRWAGQRERRRREFVDAALRAIAEHGAEVSTEQIAATAGVARTQLYKHFTDATELRMAIADRAKELLGIELKLRQLHGTPMQMIETAVGAHLAWLSRYRNLYHYLTRYSLMPLGDERDPITDVKTAIGRQLVSLFEASLERFDLGTRLAQPISFGIVGLVDAAGSRWLDDPKGMSQTELTSLLSRSIWAILDDNLRSGGIEVSPDLPLVPPDRSAEPPPPELENR